jgi:hypothetical protein
MAAPAPTAPKTDPVPVAKFKYPPHPIAEIFPMLDPFSAEFLALVEDIKENDLREPIVIYEDKILDGAIATSLWRFLHVRSRTLTSRSTTAPTQSGSS